MFKNTYLVLGLLAGTLSAPQAWAVDNNSLDLTGDVSQTIIDSFVLPPDRFDIGRLDLLGLSSFSVVQGDTITATVTLTNGPFVVPASPAQFFGLNFGNFTNTEPTFDPIGAPVVSGNFVFKLLGATVKSASGSCSNCASLITFEGPGASFSFDSIEATLSFDNLTDTFLIDLASISYQLSQPVPEPATWALWLGGVAALSGWAQRRRAVAG